MKSKKLIEVGVVSAAEAVNAVHYEFVEGAVIPRFDENDNVSLVVPEVAVGIEGSNLPVTVNDELLQSYQSLLMQAQTSLDRIPTSGEGLFAGTTDKEKALFATLTRLNADVVLRILIMRKLIMRGRMGK